MRALRWLWLIGIPLYLAIACGVAAVVSGFFRDEPAHIRLAYFLGAFWWTGRVTEGYGDWKS